MSVEANYESHGRFISAAGTDLDGDEWMAVLSIKDAQRLVRELELAIKYAEEETEQ